MREFVVMKDKTCLFNSDNYKTGSLERAMKIFEDYKNNGHEPVLYARHVGEWLESDFEIEIRKKEQDD